MEYSIKASSGCIDYTLVRKKNMKNIRIRVTGHSKLVVSAPYHSPQSRIHQFILDNAEFIVARQKQMEDKRCTYYPISYSGGDTFWHLGKETGLEVAESVETSAVLCDGALILYVPTNSDAQYRKQLFMLWSKRCAKSVFTSRVNEILPAFSHLTKQTVRISVKNMLTRWGSINPKRHTISISIHLLRCEQALIDYVIMHELCHLVHANHSKAFYLELEKYCPNRKQMDKRLKEYGLFDF